MRINFCKGWDWRIKKVKALSSTKKRRILYKRVIQLREEKVSYEIISKATNINITTLHYNVSTFDEWTAKEDSAALVIRSLFHKYKGMYGYRRIADDAKLIIPGGIGVNQVAKIMSENCLFAESPIKMSRPSSYDGEPNFTAEDLIKRDFFASRPLHKIYTDITYIKYKDHEFYLSIFVDGFNNELLHWTITKTMDAKVIFKGLEKKLFSKFKKGLEVIIHSDHGAQYKSIEYIALCEKYGVKRSLSRVGKSIDNGLVESIFGRIKIEFCRNKRIKFQNVEDFVNQLNSYLNWYNTSRIIKKLKMSPVSFRLKMGS